jgi:tetratricopeptide (TPR) repeat protein
MGGTATGRALASEGKLDQALAVLLEAADRDPADVEAHLAIYEVAQILRRPALALEHQRRAIALAPIHSTFAGVSEDYALLVPCVPGPFTANTPVDLLFDPARVTLHRWYVDPTAPIPPLPRHDAVFVAAGESSAAQPALRMLAAFARRCGVPVVNRPAAIARLGRVDFAETFAGARFCRVAPTVRIGRAAYARDGFALPHIARPLDSHGGHGLARIDDDAARHAFLAGCDAAELYVSRYVDYRSADGFFRKYRILFVGGEPWPFHLAISPNWMVHYYNSPMTEHQWMRDEEHAFLAGMGDVFGGELAEALREASRLLPLEYVGIDCAIDRDGRLLIFEADNALIVHQLDDPVMFGYKHAYVPRIKTAIDAMMRKALRPSPFALRQAQGDNGE